MMVFTHMLFGIALAAIVSSVFPISPSALVAAGLVGGALPDGDMLLTHRKTFHFPVMASVVALLLLGASQFSDATVIVLLFVGSSAAAMHSVMDILGGGKEMRPWRETDDRAVYNHATDRWIPPLRVFYDGSVPDLLLAVSLGGVAGWMLPRRLWPVIVAVVLVSVLYTVLRRAVTKWIPEQYTTFSSFLQEYL